MYSPIFLSTENHLNKILKKQKKTKHNMAILFTSLWDDNSSDLVEALKKDNAMANLYGSEPGRGTRPLYIANSFMMPHAFVIFKTFKVPALVKLCRDSVRCEDYLPKVYEELGL
tara:strand:+ start:563 stop:904 length:342 start_codon:yes stop_codon:yes gene_type:complete